MVSPARPHRSSRCWRRIFSCDHRHGGRDRRDKPPHLLGAQGVVDRDGDRPDPHRAEEAENQLRDPRQQQAHPVAAADARGREKSGKSRGEPRDLPVGQRALVGDDERLRGLLDAVFFERPARGHPRVVNSHLASSSRRGSSGAGSSGRPAATGVSTYSRSYATQSLNLRVSRPLTCQSPVMPGLTLSRASIQALFSLISSRARGRGPTRLISPRRTLTSWGSSSRLRLRRCRPILVTRGSRDHLEHRPVDLVPEVPLERFRILDHRPELQHPELLAALAAPVSGKRTPAPGNRA